MITDGKLYDDARTFQVQYVPGFLWDTVDRIRVIDAWQMTNGTIQDAEKTFRENLPRYHKEHGRGRYSLVEMTGSIHEIEFA